MYMYHIIASNFRGTEDFSKFGILIAICQINPTKAIILNHLAHAQKFAKLDPPISQSPQLVKIVPLPKLQALQ